MKDEVGMDEEVGKDEGVKDEGVKDEVEKDEEKMRTLELLLPNYTVIEH